MMIRHADRFAALTRLLRREEDLWRPRPFVQRTLPWESERPALSRALRSMDRDDILHFESRPTHAPAVRAAAPDLVRELESLTAWPAWYGAPRGALERFAQPKRVSSRKWSQIRYFVDALGAHMDPGLTRAVDWCSGKGHLARALAERFGLPVTCVERDAALCRVGAQEASLGNAAVTFKCLDALSTHAGSVLDHRTAAVGLHACGRLNIALLISAAERRVPFLATAPCCYQQIEGMTDTPVSAEARADALPLTRHELRLPSLDEVTAAPAKRVRRRKEHAFRLGLDLLQRQATGADRYRPLGRIRPAWLKGDFAHFAVTAAAAKGVPLPAHIDWSSAEADGWDRFYEATALSFARSLFRRALESRQLLDRVLFLESQGYRVQVGEFCPPEVTPRNLLIIARLAEPGARLGVGSSSCRGSRS